jgi:hypothetical protein
MPFLSYQLSYPSLNANPSLHPFINAKYPHLSFIIPLSQTPIEFSWYRK